MDENVALTQFTQFSGCGAKLGPGMLEKALCGLKQPKYDELLSDFGHCEDAGIYQINDDVALVQTVDFFPPIVDDPYVFGQIAAANALSDVYAMGARPVTALSIVGFPQKKLNIKHMRAMMDGGLNKLIEAGCALVGGHSIEDDELKFGFAVTGIVHPKKYLRNNGIQNGDILILTKPLGTGLINTALRAEIVHSEAVNEATRFMTMLNKYVAEIMEPFAVSACTDVTGFGLLGHACEMIIDTPFGIDIDFAKVPFLPFVQEYVESGMIPAGTYNNKQHRESFIKNRNDISPDIMDLLFDPQTSGGLLISISEKTAPKLLDELGLNGYFAAQIGKVNNNAETIIIKE